MVRRAKWSKSVTYSLCFPLPQSQIKSPTTVYLRRTNIGSVKNYPKSCFVFALWMSGWSRRKSSDKSFVRMWRGSLLVAVTVFGFTMTAFLRIYRAAITCSSSGHE